MSNTAVIEHVINRTKSDPERRLFLFLILERKLRRESVYLRESLFFCKEQLIVAVKIRKSEREIKARTFFFWGGTP